MCTTALPWALAQGPPWTRETGGSSESILALALVLGAVVLLLSVVVVYLLRREPGVADVPGQSPAVREDVRQVEPEGEEPSEFEQIRQIDAAVEGRLPQQAIVERTDWSEAKVSRVVSRLTEEGRIEKTRVGRRNVIEVVDDPDTGQTEPGEAT